MAADPHVYSETIQPPLTESVRDAQIAQAAKRLSARLDDVTRLMVDRMVADVPVYKRLPPDGIADVEALATRNTRVLSAALEAISNAFSGASPGIGLPLVHLAALTIVFAVLARLSLRRFA